MILPRARRSTRRIRENTRLSSSPHWRRAAAGGWNEAGRVPILPMPLCFSADHSKPRASHRMAASVRIFAFCGSLRNGSYNRMALRAARELAPEGTSFDTVDIGAIPLYNEDVRAQGFPPPVAEMRERIRAADAILFVTPEYNYSVPGVLKNAIDWASRPPDQPFNGKPAAIM